MSRSSELTIVLNPKAAGGGRYGEARIEGLRTIAGSGAAIFVTSNRELTDAVAEGVRERGVGTVGIIGGDGTVSNVIGALHRAFGNAPLPRLALLRGGTMNTIANSFGLPRRQPEELLRRLLAARSSDVARRATLKVEDRVGFMFSAGVMAGFLKALYSSVPGNPGPLSAFRLLAKGSWQALSGGPVEEIETPLLATLTVDAEVHPARRYTVFGAATVEQVGLGFRPFTRAHECLDQFQVFAFHASMQALVRQLPRIRRGLPVTKGLGFDPLARRLVIDGDGKPIAYGLDGELYEAAGQLTVDVGPQIEIRKF